LIDLGAREHHRFDWASARSAARVQHLRLPNLLWQIWGGVDQEPVLAVGADGKACLGARPHARVARPCQTACGAATIPLRKASSRRRAEHEDGESPHSGPTQTRRDQNSAGRYPLISRPMQISTRVGVVHAIGRPLAFPDSNKVDRDRPPRKHLRKHAGSINASEARSREKTGPLRVRFAVRRRGGRQSPSRGEQLTALRLQSGRMGNRLPPVITVCRYDFLTQCKGLHASHAAIVRRDDGAARRCPASSG
jgi:hypothetical protein